MKSKKIKLLFLTIFSVVLLACSLTFSASAAKSISKAVISSIPDCAYTGSYIKPKVTVKLSSKTLALSRDYVVSYTSNRSIGVATVKVTGKGSYSGTIAKKFKIVPGKVASLKASTAIDSAKIAWSKSAGANGYQVSIYSLETGKRVQYYNTTATALSLKNLQKVSDYQVKIRSYAKASSSYFYSAYRTFEFSTKPDRTTKVRVTQVGVTSASISWNPVEGATGYYVYMKKSSASSFTLIGATKGLKYNFSSLSPCTDYSFAVKTVYLNSLDQKIFSANAKGAICLTLPKKVSGIYTSEITNTTLTISWIPQSNVTGYLFYIRNNETGKYTRLAALKRSIDSFKVTGLEELTKYTFLIRSYYKVATSKYNYSDVATYSAKTDCGNVSGIAFTSTPSSAMKIGKTFTVGCEIIPYYATNKSTLWTSSNTSIVAVSQKGVIKAIGPGKAKITVTTVDGGFKASFYVTVSPTAVTGVTAPKAITLYVGESAEINPTISPSNATNKDFTVTGEDYTYQYPLGFLKRSDTCIISDYLTISGNKITAKQATVEPKPTDSGKSFSFVLTVTTADGAKKATTKVTIAKNKPFTLEDKTDSQQWYYGNVACLTLTLNTSDFEKKDIIWSSSDESIAKVLDKNGKVKCLGIGNVTITAENPSKTFSASVTFYVRSSMAVTKTYYENCKVGDTYQLEASIMPKTSVNKLVYTAVDSSIASVDSTGMVKINGSGTACIIVAITNQQDSKKIYFTDKTFVAPTGSKAELFSTMSSSANSIKSNMPGFFRNDNSAFSSFNISTATSDYTSQELSEILEGYASSSEQFVKAVDSTNYPDAQSASLAASNYYTALPVAGQIYSIVPGLDVNKIKSIDVFDDGSYTYDMKLTLEDEYFSEPTRTPLQSNHGKIFDILTQDYLSSITSTVNEQISFSYQSFTQRYHDSSLTLTINKVTGEVTDMTYDMNLDVNISQLKMALIINSDISFTVENVVHVGFID